MVRELFRLVMPEAVYFTLDEVATILRKSRAGYGIGLPGILVIAAADRSTVWPAERGCFDRSTLTVCWRKWHAPHATPAAQG
jgi:hypothetical protein